MILLHAFDYKMIKMLKGGKSTLKNNNRYSYEQKSLQYSNSGRAGHKTGTKPR